MTWTKLDDAIFDHPKMLRAGEDAANLYVRALVYSNRHLTDGRLYPEVLAAITSRRDAAKLAAKLVEVGAWRTELEGGWTIHDFHAFNPSAGEVKARRDEISRKRAEAGKRGGIASGAARSNEANGKQTGSNSFKQNEAPSRPVLEEKRESAREEANEANGAQPSPPAAPLASAPSAPPPTATPGEDAPRRPAMAPSVPDGGAGRASGWEEIQEALMRASGGTVDLLSAPASVLRDLRTVLAEMGVDARLAAAMGAIARSPATAWPWMRTTPKRVTAQLLLGRVDNSGERDARALSELVAAAREKVAAGRTVRVVPTPSPLDAPLPTEEELAAARVRHAAFLEKLKAQSAARKLQATLEGDAAAEAAAEAARRRRAVGQA